MSILIDKSTRLIVQGITGRDGLFHAKKMKEYGTFLHRVFSKAVQPSMKVVVEVYINDFFLAVEYANKMVRQIKEWCFF